MNWRECYIGDRVQYSGSFDAEGTIVRISDWASDQVCSPMYLTLIEDTDDNTSVSSTTVFEFLGLGGII